MKYQIQLLGTPWNVNDLAQVIQVFHDVEIVDGEHIDSKLPLLCLYYGRDVEDATPSKEVENLIRSYMNRRMILPIAQNPDDFKTKFPEGLKQLNGFFLKKDDMESLLRLKNYIATYFGLLEGNKKVFISYRRTDTEPLAHKLHSELVKRKFHPFLDAYSIEEGVNFQDYLRHELVDSEVVILLDTPNFNSSDYCMEEFNIANQERIPVVDVRFRVNPKTNLHRFCCYWETDLDCNAANSNSDLVCKIIELMETVRVSAYKFKRDYVLDEFNALCRKYDLSVVECGSFIRCDTTHECFYPLTNIPTATDMYKVNSFFSKMPLFSTYAKKILYNGNYCREDVSSYLSWLDSNLPIHIFNITR